MWFLIFKVVVLKIMIRNTCGFPTHFFMTFFERAYFSTWMIEIEQMWHFRMKTLCLDLISGKSHIYPSNLWVPSGFSILISLEFRTGKQPELEKWNQDLSGSQSCQCHCQPQGPWQFFLQADSLIRAFVVSGGLFPVHEKSKYQDVPCSPKVVSNCFLREVPKAHYFHWVIFSQVYNRGIQRLEAMLYAVDAINQDQTLLR